MKTRRATAYCSATDRSVPVLLRSSTEPEARKGISYRDAKRLRCLEYGVRCTGHLCPLFDVEPLAEEQLKGSPLPRPD